MILSVKKYPEKSSYLFLWVFFLLFFCVARVFAGETANARIAVLFSQNIKPYYEAVDGLLEGLKKNGSASEVEIIEFEAYSKKTYPLTERIVSGNFGTIVAVGPEASVFVSSLSKNGMFRFYIMLLDPENSLPPDDNSGCGVSLNIPVTDQLSGILRVFPKIRKIGIVFDPRNNNVFVRKTALAAKQLELSIVELPVSATSDIPGILDRNLSKIDLLWLIPDTTVISESITPYIIRKALDKSLPSVGYNRFFQSNGAAMSFIFDYKKIGRQSAALISGQNAKNKKPCTFESPVYEVIINTKIMNLLGFEHEKNGRQGTNAGD